MVEMGNSRQCIYCIILERLIYYTYCNAFLGANKCVGLVLTCYMVAFLKICHRFSPSISSLTRFSTDYYLD